MNVDIKAYDVRIYKWKCWSWVRNGGPEVLLNKKLQGNSKDKSDLTKFVFMKDGVTVCLRVYSFLLYVSNNSYHLLPPYLLSFSSTLPSFIPPTLSFLLSIFIQSHPNSLSSFHSLSSSSLDLFFTDIHLFYHQIVICSSAILTSKSPLP